LVISISVNAETQIIHEDVEDNDTSSWSVVHKRSGAVISNIADPDSSDNKVIKLEKNKKHPACRFSFSESESAQFKLQWKMKFSEQYEIQVKCKTTRGPKNISYFAGCSASEKRKKSNHRLGAETINGQWITVLRDLQRDLHSSSHRIRIISVDSITVKGNGLLDDIVSREYPDADHDLIPDVLRTEGHSDWNS
jgi:hypothetical protein